jgi:hypothetical protein
MVGRKEERKGRVLRCFITVGMYKGKRHVQKTGSGAADVSFRGPNYNGKL